jgi:NitT/TauT family transport system permease protein
MKGRRHALVIGLQVATLVAILAVWELLTRTGVIKPFLLAPPSAIGRQILAWATSGVLVPAIADTMYVLLTGYLIGVAGGVVIGMLTGRIAFFRHYFDVFIVFLNSLPRLVLIPFFIILFGFGHAPGIIVTALIVIFVVTLNTRVAVDEFGADFVQNARVLGATPIQLLTSVYLPGVALSIVSSARLSIGLGFQAAVVAQFFGSPAGLGFLIATGQQSYNPTQIYAGIVVTSILAYLMDMLLGQAGKRASRWLPANA